MLWKALHETEAKDKNGKELARLSQTLNDAFIVMLLTAQRMGEVCGMRWEDVDHRSRARAGPADSPGRPLHPHPQLFHFPAALEADRSPALGSGQIRYSLQLLRRALTLKMAPIEWPHDTRSDSWATRVAARRLRSGAIKPRDLLRLQLLSVQQQCDCRRGGRHRGISNFGIARRMRG